MMTRRTLIGAALGAVVALIGLALTPSTSLAQDDAKRTLPNWQLKGTDGKPVRLYDALDRGPVLLSFWATWCKPCLQEMPHLSELHAHYKDMGLQTYAISIDKPRSKNRVLSMVNSQKWSFPVLLDPNQDAYRRMQAQSVPYVLLLQQDGEVAYVKVGYRPGDEKDLEVAVKTLLGVEDEDSTEGNEES